jgi:hypothetical protein
MGERASGSKCLKLRGLEKWSLKGVKISLLDDDDAKKKNSLLVICK